MCWEGGTEIRPSMGRLEVKEVAEGERMAAARRRRWQRSGKGSWMRDAGCGMWDGERDGEVLGVICLRLRTRLEVGLAGIRFSEEGRLGGVRRDLASREDDRKLPVNVRVLPGGGRRAPILLRRVDHCEVVVLRRWNIGRCCTPRTTHQSKQTVSFRSAKTGFSEIEGSPK